MYEVLQSVKGNWLRPRHKLHQKRTHPSKIHNAQLRHAWNIRVVTQWRNKVPATEHFPADEIWLWKSERVFRGLNYNADGIVVTHKPVEKEDEVTAVTQNAAFRNVLHMNHLDTK